MWIRRKISNIVFLVGLELERPMNFNDNIKIPKSN